MELEISAEVELCEPIFENITLAEKYLDEGHAVAMLSDMYHSPETLRRMVAKVSPRLDECDIMDFAECMRKAYAERKRPSLSRQAVEKLDRKFSYETYVQKLTPMMRK